MVQFTVEETNLMSIYHEGGKAQLMENMTAALPDMDADMRELARYGRGYAGACRAHHFQSGRFDR